MRGIITQGALQGESLIQTTDRMAGSLKFGHWQAKRIVRTEHSLAIHRQQIKDVQEMMADDDGLVMPRGLVATFDPRTADDSRYVHGQQREWDKPFVDAKGVDTSIHRTGLIIARWSSSFRAV